MIERRESVCYEKLLGKGVAIVLAFALVFPSVPHLAVAEEITGEASADTLAEDASALYDVQLSVTYGQTAARSILDMVNELRTGDDAWYWASDDTTKVTCSGLSELTYDYDLEAIAMQRAAESAIYWSHTRPNGSSCKSAYGNYTCSTYGECICYGYTTAESAFTGWEEENESYSGQGHRRIMLNSSISKIGIGHVYFNGVHYWVLEVARSSNSSTKTVANDSAQDVTVSISEDMIKSVTAEADPEEYNLRVGDSESLPELSVKLQTTSAYPARLSPVSIDYEWELDDSSCVTVSGDLITAQAVGTATLITTALGNIVTVPVKVSEPLTDISACSVTLSSTIYTYNGKAQTPAVTVVANGTDTLIKGTDYTVAYSNNTNAGTATVTVTGIGDYTGTVTKTFTINKASQKISASIGSTNILKGGSAQITASAAGNGTISYASSDTSVATVSSSGVVKGTGAGTAVITVTAAATKNYKTATTTIMVNVLLDMPVLSGASNTAKGVKVSWTAVSGAEKYRVFRKTSGGSWIKVGDTVSTSYTDTTAMSGTTYYYTVRCINSEGNAYTSSYNKTGVKVTYIAAPSLSSVSNTTSGVKVTWGAVDGAVKYRVFRKTSGGSWKKIGDTTGTSYTDTTAASGTTYYYTVRCINSAGTSYTSSYNSTGLSIKYLTAGKISSLTNTSSGITVKWSKVTGASGYYVYRKTSGGSYSKIKTVTSGSTVSYTDTAVKSKNGTTYVYAVRPYYSSTLGSYTGKTTVRLTGTSLSSVTNSASKKMTVKWSKASGVTGYQIQYSTSSTFASGNTTVTVSGASTVSKVISSLTKGKTYYVRVRTYKTVSGTKYYSAWSSKKSVKISK